MTDEQQVVQDIDNLFGSLANGVVEYTACNVMDKLDQLVEVIEVVREKARVEKEIRELYMGYDFEQYDFEALEALDAKSSGATAQEA